MGVSAFAAPEEGQAFLAGVIDRSTMPDILPDTVLALASLLMVVLNFTGNVIFGVAVWRSPTLPRAQAPYGPPRVRGRRVGAALSRPAAAMIPSARARVH